MAKMASNKRLVNKFITNTKEKMNKKEEELYNRFLVDFACYINDFEKTRGKESASVFL